MSQKLVLNIVFALIAAVSLIGVVASRGAKPEYSISIGILASPDDEDYAGAKAFKEYVESRSKGRVAVRIFTSGQYCGGERECIENLQSGVLDVFMTTFGGLGNFFGPGQAFDLPYVFADDAVAECVLDGPIEGALRDAVLKAGLGMRLMTIGNTGGWRDIATRSRVVHSPADLKGLKIRTTPSQLEQRFVRDLGANPTPIAWSEVYLALATGVVDGTKNSIQDIVGMRLEEHIKRMTLDHHAYMGAVWWYSEKRWEEMPEDLKSIVAEGFSRLQKVTRELPKQNQSKALEQFKAAGGEVITPTQTERAEFEKAASGMRDWFAKTYGREWLDKLDKAVAACTWNKAGKG